MVDRGSEPDPDSAGERAAARAPVTPRVYAPNTGDPLPLADCVRRLIERRVKGIVCLHGPPGSGKTTALRHLKAVLPAGTCPQVIDGPLTDFRPDPASDLTIYTDHAPAGTAIPLQMAAWSTDDCIEYLLAQHPNRCTSVMSRVQALPNASILNGRPELWRILLDAFAGDESMREVAVALRLALAPLLTLHGGPVGLFCLESLCSGFDLSNAPELGIPTSAGRLVRHRPVQLILAADRIVEQFCERRGESDLERVLPADLILEVARLAGFWRPAIEFLTSLASSKGGPVQSMAISIKVCIDKSWRPAGRPANLACAVLSGVDWQRVDLSGTNLQKAQLNNADLRYAKLRFGHAESANFAKANLRFASLRRLDASRSNFHDADLSYARAKRLKADGATFEGARLNAASLVRADLRRCCLKNGQFIAADLTRADLRECDLNEADFTDADLRHATLDECNLAVATFDRALFSGASLRDCNLASMYLPAIDFSGAVLYGSDLTAAMMPRGNFERADLSNTGLADVDWEGANLRHADLRNASFHLGSTRSGLVGSSIPSEGSRTGFYTDDYDEQTYRSAEEIRKANLRGADLRGANIAGVDFYLVDLRDASYTESQREHFISCRAILGDPDA